MRLSGHRSSDGRPDAEVNGATQGSGSLLGRDTEVAELELALDATARGQGTLFVVTGEAGIGKTRLSDEAAARAGSLGFVVAWGRCWEGGGAPAYWPWIQVLRTCATTTDLDPLVAKFDPAGAHLASLVRGVAPAVRGDGADAYPEHERFVLFDALTRLLAEVAATRPLLVLLDDLHAADAASLRLLQFLARSLREFPLMVVGTSRDPGGPADPERARLLAKLHQDGRRLALSGLPATDVALLMRDRAGRPLAETLVTAVHAATSGNPFFVDEIVRLLAAQRLLDARGLQEAVHLPQQLREVIWRRLDPLPEPVIQILSVAAVLGRSFELALLADVAGSEPDAVLEPLGSAAAQGLLDEPASPAGRWMFRHGLIREALYHELSTAARVRLHRKAAQSLEARGEQHVDAHVTLLAHHYLQAAAGGDADKAVTYAWRAGDAATAVLAFEEAVAQYRHALELADQAGLDLHQRTELMLTLAAAQTRSGAFVAAKGSWEEAMDLARATGQPEQMARAALGASLPGMLFGVTDTTRVAFLEEALAVQGPAPTAWRTRLLARLAAELYWSSDRERSVALSEEAVALAESVDDDAVRAYTLHALHYAQRGPDAGSGRPATAARIVALAERAHDTELALAARAAHVVDLFEIGDLEGMDDQLETLSERAGRLQHPAFRWYAAVYQLVRALLEGRFADADALGATASEASLHAPEFLVGRFFAEAVSDLRELDDHALRQRGNRLEEMADRYPGVFLWRCLLALNRAVRGQVESAHGDLIVLVDQLLGQERRDAHWLVGCCLLAEAAAVLSAAVREGPEVGRAHPQASLSERNDAGEAKVATRLADALRPYADRLAVAGRVAACRGSVSYALGVVGLATGELDPAVSDLDHAVASHRSLGARPHLARSLVALADALERRAASGDRARSSAVRQEAAALAEELGLDRLAARANAAAAAPDLAWEGVLRREGEYWSVGDDTRVVRLRDARGLHHLAVLLSAPGEAVHALDLVVGGRSRPGNPRGGGAAASTDAAEGLAVRRGDTDDAVLDPQAKSAYRQRLGQLADLMAAAERSGDQERFLELRSETQALEEALAGAQGLGGRDRTAPNAAERARVSVRKALSTALARITRAHPALGEHLQATIRTGTYCAYEPDPLAPVRWRFE
jgi:tetratricopeptide (TPR) repeat protein